MNPKDGLKVNEPLGMPAEGTPKKSPGFFTQKRIFIAGLITSVLIHLGLILFLPLLVHAPKDRKTALRVWLSKPAPEEKEQKDQERHPKPVVSVTPTESSQKPKNARYLAEADQTAAKEKRARAVAASSDDAAGAPKPREKTPEQKQADSDRADDGDDEKAHPVEEGIGPNLVGEKRAPRAGKRKGQRRDPADPLNIRPQFEELAYGKPNTLNDYLPDVDEGDETKLNTWQWRHAPFFNRIKSRIGKVWAPQAQIARFDPQGVLLGQIDRVTVMSVTIDREGRLTNLKVSGESGVAYLDDEAERAFLSAAPFPFPPSELFSDKDEFSFTFAFHLQVSRGFSFDFEW